MDEIDRSVDMLIQTIKNSQTYIDYMACEQELAKKPELKQQINAYRVSAYQLIEAPQEDLYDEADALEARFEELRRNTDVNAYLEAELSLCRLLQKIAVRIDSAVGLDIPEM